MFKSVFVVLRSGRCGMLCIVVQSPANIALVPASLTTRNTRLPPQQPLMKSSTTRAAPDCRCKYMAVTSLLLSKYSAVCIIYCVLFCIANSIPYSVHWCIRQSLENIIDNSSVYAFMYTEMSHCAHYTYCTKREIILKKREYTSMLF